MVLDPARVPCGADPVVAVVDRNRRVRQVAYFRGAGEPKSNLATEIYSEDGKMIGSFFVQNRSYCDYDELSPSLVAALVSTEDMRFYSHSGIDFISLARVAVRTIALAQFGQGGGSTISQQLARTSTRAIPRHTTIRSRKDRSW